METQKESLKSYIKSLRLPAAAWLVLVLLLALALACSRYAAVGGRLYPCTAQELDLRGLGITHTAPLTRFPELQSVDLRDNPLSPEEVAALRQALPVARSAGIFPSAISASTPRLRRSPSIIFPWKRCNFSPSSIV